MARSQRQNLVKWSRTHYPDSVVYATKLGAALSNDSLKILDSDSAEKLAGQFQLVFTSPPFPLNTKKRYGNLRGEEYRTWLTDLAPKLTRLLSPSGSIVLELGNAWQPGEPVMSTLAIETLLAFKKRARLHLCQEFIWYNPARLPTPAQWVTIDRIRVKDAFTRLWWMSPTPNPKADNRRVLSPYSGSMKTLLRTGKYNAGRRPSQHVIGKTSFLANNGGAIPPNVLQCEPEEESAAPSNLLVGGNTESSEPYHVYCKQMAVTPHPARMPVALARFFINLCTDPDDLVFDPFGGSNTTGAAAEQLRRRWLTIESNREYAAAGVGRFPHLTGVGAAPPHGSGEPDERSKSSGRTPRKRSASSGTEPR